MSTAYFAGGPKDGETMDYEPSFALPSSCTLGALCACHSGWVYTRRGSIYVNDECVNVFQWEKTPIVANADFGGEDE